jgi:predicted nucleic acid-binding protein
VVLDVLLDGEPFAEPAADLLSRAEAGEIAGCICATTITTIHYLAAKVVGAEDSLLAVRKLLSIFEVAPVNRPVLEAALDSRVTDFEDAVLHEAARQVFAQAIVTRNPKDFKKSDLLVYSPQELRHVLDLRS